MSIMHRITGAALAAGGLLMTWWLFAALSGVHAFAIFQSFRTSVIGEIMMFGWVFSFVYHFFNGIRHLKWDAGYGISIKRIYRSGYVVIAGTAIITLMIWLTAGAK